MSVCISKHGEFGAHTPDADYVCTWCGVLDEDSLITELNGARARVAELERQRDAVLALCDKPIEPWEHAEERLGEVRKIYGGGQ